MNVCAVCTEPVATVAGRTVHATSWGTADGWHRPEPTALDAVRRALSATVR